MKRKLLILFVALLWSGVLFFFSGQSGTESANISLNLAKWLVERFDFDMTAAQLEPVLRKLAHVCIFALEGFLVYCTLCVFRMGRRGNWLIAVVICAVVGALNEAHQMFAVERSCQFTDVLIDTAGAVMGISFAAFAGWLMHMLDRRHRV